VGAPAEPDGPALSASRVACAVPGAAEVLVALVDAPAVGERWTEESACPWMTVGGLAHHLAEQIGIVVRLLSASPAESELIPLVEHYRRAAWVNSGVDSEANVRIRDAADQQARAGHEALRARLRVDLAALEPALAPVLAGERRPATVHVPWQGWSLSVDDFLTTRLIEMVVHSEDLASSVDLPFPAFPDPALGPVLALLTAVAVDRHGQAAVIRALSRPQRAPESVSAF